MSVKPVVLIVTASTVIAALTGTLLGRAAAGTVPAPVALSTVEPTPAPTPAPDPIRQVIGRAPAVPRLTAGTGPYGAIVDTGTPSVALTFDDGPDPTWTPRILDALRRWSVRATFCLIGVHAQDHPELVAAIAADGHTLCNHSWNHNTALGSASYAAIRADLARTTAAIQAAAPGVPVAYYRQPGGFWTGAVVVVARELGLAPLHWSVDPRDWSRPPAGTIASTVAAGCRDGAVVLLHDGGGNRTNTVDAVTHLLPTLLRAHPLIALPTGDPA